MSLTRLALAGAVAATGALTLSFSALAAVSISKAELSGTQLRVEGTASPNHQITVNGVSMTTSDAQGQFKLQNDSFAAPSDCRVSVNDGSATAATATLSGCSVSTAPSSPPPLSPTPPQSPSPSPNPGVAGRAVVGDAHPERRHRR